MTKEELLEYLDDYEDGEEVDLAEIRREIARDKAERHAMFIEELEENQHASGFYAFQDTLEMFRRER